MVGLLPLFAAVQLDAALWERLPMFRERARWYIENKPGLAEFLHQGFEGLVLRPTERLKGPRCRRSSMSATC